MSDGITLYCPFCGKYKAIQKEGKYLSVHLCLPVQPYESKLPVYSCEECKLSFVIERVTR